MSCRCGDFGTIELYREDIAERVKRTRTLRRTLDTIVEHPLEEHKLLKCPVCDQFWQIGRAWNWGNFEYLFKVPEMSSEDWLSLPYVQPGDFLFYPAVMERYFEDNDFTPTDRKCRAEECLGNAIKYTVHCADQHILSLEKAGAITRKPEGRPLPDYL